MRARNVIAFAAALLLGALGYALYDARRATDAPTDPLLVMVNQMRTRALVEHEREITVWYRSCPEVPGLNPEVLVIWPGKLSYELDLARTRLELQGEVLRAFAPAIRADEPSIPSELGEYVARSSIWTLPSDQQLVLDEMKKASPLARHLSIHYLRNDPELVERFRKELAEWLGTLAATLGVKLRAVEVQIAPSQAVVPARPMLALCEGGSALANGQPFVRRRADGSEAGLLPVAHSP